MLVRCHVHAGVCTRLPLLPLLLLLLFRLDFLSFVLVCLLFALARLPILGRTNLRSRLCMSWLLSIEGFVRLSRGRVVLVLLFTVVLSVLRILAVVLSDKVLGRHARGLSLGRVVLLVVRIVITAVGLGLNLLVCDLLLGSWRSLGWLGGVAVAVGVAILVSLICLLRLLLLRRILEDWVSLLVVVPLRWLRLVALLTLVAVVADEGVIIPRHLLRSIIIAI